MKIRVLGCHGGTSPDHKNSCFMIGERLLMDAGHICATLTMEEQANVEDIILTGAAMDRLADLGAFAENVSLRRRQPVVIHCTQAVADALKKHHFNGLSWPDFTVLPSASQPVLRIKVHAFNKKFTVQDFEAVFVPMKHSAESSGVVLRQDAGSVAFGGATGPSTALWDQVNKTPNIRALFIECSHPTSMQKQADTLGHLTPATVNSELSKLMVGGFPIFAYHLKPPTYAEIRRELRALKRRELHLARPGDIYEL